MFVATPDCGDFSQRNRVRDAGQQLTTLDKLWESLEYVRRRAPKVVIVENVTADVAVAPITGLCSRLEGYSMEGGELDPRTTACEPVARLRHFWVLTRTEE